MTACLFRIVALLATAASCVSTVPEDEAIRRIEELEREVFGLQEKLQLAEERLGVLIASNGICDFPSPVTFPRVDARVLEVAEIRTVVLDVGSDHGVEEGFVFNVYLGSVFHGQVRVTQVEERTSRAVIFGEKHPISAGNMASTGI